MMKPWQITMILFSAPAFAAAPHYNAQPVVKPAAARLVVKDVLWRCTETSCTGSRSNSRPAIVCASLARKLGTLGSFSAGGEALPPAALDKCNARAR